MDVTLRQMRSFAAIAQLGSFTRAAKALHLSQPSLTVHIRELERQLGARLIDRNSRAARLTAVGRELLPTFQRILEDLDAVVTDTRDVVARRRGIVRVACLPSFAATVLPAAIAGFRADHPRIQFAIRDAVGRRIAAMVKSEIVDFGVTAGRVADPELDVQELMEDRMHAIFPRGHPLERKRRLTPAVLAQHPLIFMDEESTVREVVDAGFFAHRHAVAPAFEATYMATAIGLAQAGLGVALLPSSAIEARSNAQLRSRPIEAKEFTRKIWLVRQAKRSIAPAAALFLEYLARRACKAEARTQG